MSRRNTFRWLALAGFLGLAAAVVAVELVGSPRPVEWIGDSEPTGWTPDPEGVERFLEELPQPLFRDAGAETIREARSVDTFLYRAGYKAHQALYGRPWVVERQGIGDCVSWGWAHGVYVAQCVDWETGRLANPPPFPSTEAIYGGSRVEARGKSGEGSSPVGGYSDGSYGAAAARWVRDWGVVYRSEVGGHDLRVYSADRAKSWGAYGNGGKGDAGKLDTLAKRHPATHVALVKTFAEAAAAIEAGFPVPVCSMQGFASVRDANGFAAASGSWAHCMCFVGVRYAKNGSPEDALLCLNSWGPRWISGPRWPEDMPEGSFWVRRSVVDRMLGNQPDSFAVGSISGFGWRDLDNGAFLTPAPPEVRGRRPASIETLTALFGLSL
ncbi:MAG: hypothetical protein RLZZ21_287 [Planctomycetota bacterium]|jgi:hypothetical protein